MHPSEDGDPKIPTLASSWIILGSFVQQRNIFSSFYIATTSSMHYKTHTLLSVKADPFSPSFNIYNLYLTRLRTSSRLPIVVINSANRSTTVVYDILDSFELVKTIISIKRVGYVNICNNLTVFQASCTQFISNANRLKTFCTCTHRLWEEPGSYSDWDLSLWSSRRFSPASFHSLMTCLRG